MTIDNINIEDTLKEVKALMAKDKDMSPSVKSTLKILVLIITLLVNRISVNSSNSSNPPSSDPNREKKPRKKSTKKKPGGQKGHKGTTLKKVENPDKIEVIKVSRASLPKGDYKEVGYETRQVFDIEITRVVTEYRAQILEDQNGKHFTAPFPQTVIKAAQYGNGTKAHAVYLSQFQLIPYDRIRDYFAEQIGVPISAGTIFNFNSEAYQLLKNFEELVKSKLSNADLAHADETGINIGGKRNWLHSASNELWTYFFPHKKRGTEAMNEIGILPNFNGILCHDHWKPYYKYYCLHSLCNAHHLRELTGVWEQDEHKWSKKMRALLKEINCKVNDAGGVLSKAASKKYRLKYRAILRGGDKECPPPDESERRGKRGRIKKTKARNLLERLRNYEDDVLRFMDNPIVPFTNNRGENDIRMTKVHQKISGCFRSEEGAKIFCLIRSYLSTCRKQNINSSVALELLFKGQLPDFLD